MAMFKAVDIELEIDADGFTQEPDRGKENVARALAAPGGGECELTRPVPRHLPSGRAGGFRPTPCRRVAAPHTAGRAGKGPRHWRLCSGRKGMGSCADGFRPRSRSTPRT